MKGIWYGTAAAYFVFFLERVQGLYHLRSGFGAAVGSL